MWTCLISLLLFSIIMVTDVRGQVLPDERRVSVEFVNIPIDSALLLLSFHSGVGIPFNPKIIPEEKRVTLSANRLMLGLALDNIFVNTDLKYRIVGSELVIEEIPKENNQRPLHITGYLTDAASGERLVFAHISTTDGLYGVTTNEFGYYNMQILSGEHIFRYSYVGYADEELTVRLNKDTTIDVQMEVHAFLSEIVIKGAIKREFKKSEDHDQMPLNQLNSLASLAGESDIFRLAQMRSGVSSQVDGFGGLYVRGGDADQNLILFDGVPIYNTGHALGLFSIFNSSAIKSADLIKGGFPARYGGRLSSIFDIRTKVGNNQELGGEAAISPLMIKGTLEGPIQKGKSSFLVSARRTIIDPWLKPLSRYQFERNNETGQINFLFYDLNARVNFELNETNTIMFSVYKGADVYANEVLGTINTDVGMTQELDVNDISWGNDVITLGWSSKLSKKLFANASLSTTSFKFDNFDFNRTIVDSGSDQNKTYVSRLFSSDIDDKIAALDVNWYVDQKYFIKIGGSYTDHVFRPGSNATAILRDPEINPLIEENDRISIASIKRNVEFPTIAGSELRAYIENDVRPSPNFSVNFGLHWSSISTGEKVYRNLQPRISAQYSFTPWGRIKAGYSKMDQFFHLLSSASLGLPSDVWLPSTDEIEPETSRQISGSVELEPITDFVIKISAFDKVMNNLTGYSLGGNVNISGEDNWQEDIAIGDGVARGVEFEIEKNAGIIRGWVSYTLSKSTRRFEEINANTIFYATNDRRHVFNIVGIGQINKNMEISANWTYASGSPVTVPSSTDPIVIDGKIQYIPIFSRVNSERLPAYHKLDLGLNVYNEYPWAKQKLTLGAYNAYARRNPFYVEAVIDESGEKFNYEQISVLPFIPYVGFTLTF